MKIRIVPSTSPTKSKIFDRNTLHQIPQLLELPTSLIDGIRLATLVFPFRVSQYAIDNLIDWASAPDDPMFRLLFPTADMLGEESKALLSDLVTRGASAEALNAAIGKIRASLNSDPSDQSVNVPQFEGRSLQGIQHKYAETVLAFPSQGQTCHSYCSFCFRWPQFVESNGPRFQLRDPAVLHRYLRKQPRVTDILLTGGDPLVMSTRRLSTYLEPLLDDNLSHVRSIRLGTKALTYWPHRFLSGDAEELIALLGKLRAAGKNISLMAHVNHWRELMPAPVTSAVERLLRVGVVIRTQSPLLRHVNDSEETWRRNWAEQVRLGLVPYYMFVERDTGASKYFGVPLAQALKIYQGAVRHLSGLGRTARGPVMSAGPGKVHLLGTATYNGRAHFVLTFIRARRSEWLQRIFFAEYSETASWLDELQPADGESKFFFEDNYQAFLAQRRRMQEGLSAEEVSNQLIAIAKTRLSESA